MGAGSVAKRRGLWRGAALVLFVALVVLRIPGLVLHPRFWAEEGRVYFSNACAFPWQVVLFRSEVGYLNLAANVAALLAHSLVRLENAPSVTTGFALLLQSLPAIVLVRARDAWLRSPPVLLVAVALVALAPLCDEIWLSTSISQFHIMLAAALCLALNVPAGRWRHGRALVLGLAPLCGPGSVALVPLFFARAAIDRSRDRLAQAACLGIGAGLQILVFYIPAAARQHGLPAADFAAIFAVKQLAVPFLGGALAKQVAGSLAGQLAGGAWPWAAFWAAGLVGAAMAVALRRRPVPAATWMVLAGGALAVLSYGGALGGTRGLVSELAGQRYAFAPNALFALAVLCLAASGRAGDSRVFSRVAGFVAVWGLAVGVMQLALPHNPLFTTGPDWQSEVAAWRADNTHPLAIWPRGWVFLLPPA